MSILTSILRPLFDGLLYPFRGLNPLVGLTLMTFLVTVLVLLVLKVTSNQDRLDAVKRKIHASLFEIRLFNDDLRAILRAQWDILRHNVSYLALWVVPLLWLIVPLVLILGQLQFHYGYRGLVPGERTLLTVELKDDAVDSDAKPEVELEVPDGLRVETAPVWVPSKKELTWRLVAEERGIYDLGVRVDGGESYDKRVVVSDDVVRRSTVRPPATFFDELLFPAEAPLPDGAPIRSIALAYPQGDAGIGWNWELTWMVVLFALSFAFALLLRKPLDVTI
jgi:hypothetical protein